VTIVLIIKAKCICESNYSCLLRGLPYVNGYILGLILFEFFIYGEIRFITHLFGTRVLNFFV